MKTKSVSPKPSRRKKIALGCILGFALLASLSIAFAVFENWSGAREWGKVRQELLQGGVELDPKKLVSGLPATDENFASLPILMALMEFEQSEEGELVYENPELVERFRRMSLPDAAKQFDFQANWKKRDKANLIPVANALKGEGDPVEKIMAWITGMRSDLKSIDEAAKRPEAVLRFRLADDFLAQINTVLPYLDDYQKFQKFQAIRVCAALNAGDLDNARSGVRTMLQASRAMGSQPILISHLVRIANLQLVLSVIWQGLDSNAWTEDDLRWLESELTGESEDLLGHLESALNLELCVMIIGGFDYLKTASPESGSVLEYLNMGAFDRIPNPGLVFFPGGIWDHNKAFGAKWLFESALGPTMRRQLSPGEEAWLNERRTPRNFMAKIMVPAFANVNMRSFEAATAVDLARVSCALERYRMEKSDYPSALGELIPEFLESIPGDLLSKEKASLRYQLSGERYVIYSVGLNGTDEKGEVVFRSPEGKRIDRERGDLVWGFEPLVNPGK